MKLTISILALMMAGGAWAQSPNIIQSTQDKLNAVQQQKTADSNAALGIASTPSSKPAPSVAATSGKPAASKPAASKPAVMVQTSAGKTASAAQTSASKPATAPQAMASKSAASAPAAASKPAPVGVTKPASSGPFTPKPAATQAAAPAGPKVIPGAKAVVAPAPASAAAKSSPAAGKTTASSKPAEQKAPAKTVAVIVPKSAKTDKKNPAKPVVQSAAPAKPEEKKYAMTGKRDPFLSPVVSHMGGSGCATGKKCLEIGQINLKGVVKSDTGMIAVVTNSVNKAYFLRENDPVFNGYVEKITGDSITFKETFQDKLGKSFTRDVVKKILTPAV